MKKLLYISLLLVSFISLAQTNVILKRKNNKKHTENQITSLLKDHWKFKDAINADYRNPDFNDADWYEVKRDTAGNIVKKEINFKGKATLRNNFEIDSTLVGVPLSLDITMDPGVFSVYINGTFYKTFGKLKNNNEPEVRHTRNIPIELDFVDVIFTKTGKQNIVIEYQDSKITKTADFLNLKVEVMKQQDALAEANGIRNATSIFVVLGSIFMTLCVFHLILYLFFRSFIPNLYFSLFNFSMGATFFVIIYMLLKGPSLNTFNITGIAVIALTYISIFALSGLVNSLFAKNKKRFKIFSIICVIGLIISIAWDENQLFLLLGLIYSFAEATILLIKAIIKKVKGARILASGILLTLFFTIALVIFLILVANKDGITVDDNDKIAMITLSIIAFGMILSVFSIPFSMSAYLAWYFSHINNENELKVTEVEELTQQKINQEKDKQSLIENINNELELKVEKRKNEIELQQTEIELQNKVLANEKRKSEALLLNILPEEVALELKEKGNTQSKFFDSVTILFTDFKDFTKLTEKVSSTELIEELNYCFKEFDRIISKYGIEKIKTIGDAYMAVSGLPKKDENHALKMVHASLEIRDFMEQYKQKRINEKKSFFEMRIGINSGEVVAGIVGIKKFAYDVWGSAVNLASEMEIHGTIGKVNISQNTFNLIKDNFDTELRTEKLQDSDVNMYFAEPKEKNVALKKVKEFIVEKQKQELPKHLHYHNINHILDVHNAVINYAKLEGISTENTELLETAALFHDSGFIVKADGHELISCEFAEEFLPNFGYDAVQIEKIKGMIMATKIPQSPTNHLEQILADADLDYLGRDDFEEISNGLFEELKAENKVTDLNTWNKIQVSFFEKHSYFTESAKRLRNDKKQQNLELIKKQLL